MRLRFCTQALNAADSFITEAQSTLLRASLIRHGILVRPDKTTGGAHQGDGLPAAKSSKGDA